MKTMEQYEVSPDSMLGLVVGKPKAAAVAGSSRQQPTQGPTGSNATDRERRCRDDTSAKFR